MKPEPYNLEFITPCFCSGANQAQAEIRASSIRGHLRWWFRALGGTQEQESEVFGSAAGNEGCASALIVRVLMKSLGQLWRPERVDPNSPTAYIYYFASVSGTVKGQRWTDQGNLPPETKFQLYISKSREISEPATKRLTEAIESFLVFGSIGLRATRGLGAFTCLERPLTPETLKLNASIIKSQGFSFIEKQSGIKSWNSAIYRAGDVLKNELRSKHKAGRNGDKPSPLGTSVPRQTSAVYLRPVLMADKTFSLILFEAPASRVLGIASCPGSPVLEMYNQK